MGAIVPEHPAYREVTGGVGAPRGFRAVGVSCGLKASGRPDIALIAANQTVSAAAVFTTNSVAAAPVVVSREHLEAGLARVVVVNSGNANACTGEQGLAHAVGMASATAAHLGCQASEVVVASTGVIGVPLPMERVVAGIEKAAGELGSDPSSHSAAQAIMTTDTFSKECAVALESGEMTVTVGGMAKGSGMIEPHMATMLAFVTTDAALTPAACDVALRAAVARTFNRISVDGDMSTNDMCLLMASGAAGGGPIGEESPEFPGVSAAIAHVCGELARMIVRDGEGATKFIEVTVRGAMSESDAELAAFSIADSPLCKTAVFGGDANWGRVAMAIGKSAARIDPSAFDITFAGVKTCVAGQAVAFDEEAASAALAKRDVEVAVDLHLGTGEATVWTCDLSYDYVRINGEYRT